jgi:hypothetical protein
VPSVAEWDADVIRFRGGLERAYTEALSSVVAQPRVRDPREAGSLIQAAIDDFEGRSLSGYLLDAGTRRQFAEFVVHRSAYQLKEADPHTWAIPRYSGRSRAALVEIQMDEYGNGEAGAAHADLFATTMRSLGLDATYGAYLDRLPAVTLATANLASMFGLHRRWLPALLGHLALFEMTSVEPMGRYAAVVDSHGLGAAAREFYDVHVIADAHHGPLAASELVGGYLAEHPQDAATLLWGAHTLLHVEDRLASALLDAWAEGASSLRPSAGTTPSQETTASSSETSSPSIRSVASAMHRWYSAREWRSS